MQWPRGASRTIARSSPLCFRPGLRLPIGHGVSVRKLAREDTTCQPCRSRREFVGGLTTVRTTGVLVLRQVAADLPPVRADGSTYVLWQLDGMAREVATQFCMAYFVLAGALLLLSVRRQ